MEIEDKYIPLIVDALNSKYYFCIDKKLYTLAKKYKELAGMFVDKWNEKYIKNE